MSKSHFCLLSFLLLFSLIISQTLPAEDLVTLKNLSWEEQKNQTRIILETNQPLIYSVTDSPTASEVLVELSNLDLRNLPQELFINTNEVVSLQTFPQSAGQKSKIIIKMTAVRPYHVTAEESKLYIDITNNPDSGDLLAPVTTQIPPSVERQVDPQLKEMEKQSGLPVNETTDNMGAAPAPAISEPEPTEEIAPPVIAVTDEEKKSLEITARATEVRDIRVDRSGVWQQYELAVPEQRARGWNSPDANQRYHRKSARRVCGQSSYHPGTQFRFAAISRQHIGYLPVGYCFDGPGKHRKRTGHFDTKSGYPEQHES